MMNSQFAEFLGRRLDELAMPNAELARRLGVSAQAVGQWRNENVLPRSNLVQPLAEALDVEPSRVAILTGHASVTALPESGARAPAHQAVPPRLAELCRDLSPEHLNVLIEFAEFLATREWRDDWQQRALARIAAINERADDRSVRAGR